MTSSEDTQKYFLALASRSVRRLAAQINDQNLDSQVRRELMNELVELSKWNRIAVVAGWSFEACADDSGGADGDQVTVFDLDTYANGQPVVTTIDWGNGFATVVHPPNSLQHTHGTDQLRTEYWPCGHRPKPTGPS